MKPYVEYLELLRKLTDDVERLCDYERQKTVAVRKDDLQVLNDVMRQEQALTLSFRGLEQKRALLLEQLGLQAVRLDDLYRHYPAELRMDAKQAAEALRRQYQIYQSAAEVARNTLECNLREIEKFLESSGQSADAGLAAADMPPAGLRTDFRA